MQPYNSLLSLAHLSSHSDGLLLVENEALSTACQKLLGIQRPAFADMNAVAARNLASVLLPSTVRPAEGSSSSGGGGGGGSGSGGSGRGAAAPRGPGAPGPGRRGGRPAWDSGFGGAGSSAAAGRSTGRSSDGGGGGGAWDGTFDMGSRWGDEGSASAGGRVRGVAGRQGAAFGKPGQLRLLSDICEQLCSHPSYRLLTLRSVPQVRACCLTAHSLAATSCYWSGFVERCCLTDRRVEAVLKIRPPLPAWRQGCWEGSQCSQHILCPVFPHSMLSEHSWRSPMPCWPFSLGQVAPGCVDFTSFNWPALLKGLKQMLATGAGRCLCLFSGDLVMPYAEQEAQPLQQCTWYSA